MTNRRGIWLVGLLLLTAALTGCVGDDGVEPASASSTPVATEQGVEDPFELVVQVRGEHTGGEPIEDARVVFYEPSAINIPEIDIPEIDVDVGPPGPGTSSGSPSEDGAGSDQPAFDFEMPPIEPIDFSGGPIVSGVTGPDGTVTGLLDTNRSMVHVLVESPEGFTDEGKLSIPVGDAGERSIVTVPVYKTHLEIQAEGTMDPSVSAREATFGMMDPEWTTVPVQLHEDPDVERAYLERLVSAEMTLTWVNDATHHGDLYAGFAAGETAPFHTGEDTRQLPLDGRVQETVAMNESEIADERGALTESGLFAAAMTDNVAVGLDGLPFTFEGDASFQGPGHVLDLG